MNKKILILIVGILIIASNLFAGDGDLIVEGEVGIGNVNPVYPLDITSTDQRAINIVTTKTAGGYGGGALNMSVTDSQTSGTTGNMNGMVVSYTHNGSIVTNHAASSVHMNLSGSGSSSGDWGKIAQSAVINFTGSAGTGYNYTHPYAYAFASRAAILTLGSQKHYFRNAGGLQVLHQYDNSTRTLSAENLYGIIVGDISQYSSDGLDVVTNAGGIQINKQTDSAGGRIGDLQGLWLNGDGLGADLVFGANKESRLYGYAGDLIIDTTGYVGIGTINPAYELDVAGTVNASGGYQQVSDIKYKKDIALIESPLEKILQMKGVSYNWKIQEYKDMGFSEGIHYGVVAQEVEKVLPEIVSTNGSGNKSVTYDEIIPVLIEAVKEQQQIIEGLKAKVQRLEAKDLMVQIKQ